MQHHTLPFLLLIAASPFPALRAQTRAMPEDGPEVRNLRSGLQYSVLQAGNQKDRPKPGDVVSIFACTWLTDGTLCEMQRNRPLRVTLGVGMPKAWTTGLSLMSKGARFKFTAPPELAYGKVGSKGNPPHVPGVPPDSTLVFELELLEIEKGITLPRFELPKVARQKVTDSGLKFEVLKQGRGARPATGERFTVEFHLFNQRGQLVSTSLAPEIDRIVGRKGRDLGGPKFLSEAIGLLRVGERMRFEVPGALGYGREGKGHLVPPNSTTFWVLELVRLDPAPAPRPVPEFEHLSRHKLKLTKSGLRYEILEPGEGRKPELTDAVEIHFAAWTSNGKRFDETFTGGVPLEILLRDRGLVAGLREGIQLMPVGAVFRFSVPPALGYGLKGREDRGIGPNRRLYFHVELISIAGDRK